VPDEIVVDLLFSACGKTNETLVRYAEIVDLDGIPVRALSVEGLLLTKQTVRDKDVMDRMVLQRALDATNRFKNLHFTYPADSPHPCRLYSKRGCKSWLWKHPNARAILARYGYRNRSPANAWQRSGERYAEWLA